MTPPGSVVQVPPLLLFVSSGDGAGLWRIDPNVDPSDRSWRTRVDAPPGRWRPTAPSSGGPVALTSVGEAPVRVALARATGDGIVAEWETTLPSGERWADGYAACVSPGGLVAVGDSGLTISVLDARPAPALVPGQRDDLGTCTWLDADTLVWDQEDRHLSMWTRGEGARVDTGLRGIAPNFGGGRFAWFEEGSTGRLHVAVVDSWRLGLRLGAEVGTLVYEPTAGQPGGFELSPDGRWLLGLGLTAAEALSVFQVTDGGLVETRSIPLAALPFETGDSVTWMPSPP